MSSTLWFITKATISGLLIAAISELAKRSSLMAALLTSLPLISILAMIWLYLESHDTHKVAALASDVFWLVLPTLPFFIVLPLLLRRGVDFSLAMLISVVLIIACYLLTMQLLKSSGIHA